MIRRGVEIFVALDPVDLRCGMDRLAGLAEEQTGRAGRSGALFVFFGKRRTALKLVFADTTGLCLFYKRLDRHRFRLPAVRGHNSKTVELSERELDELLDGLDLEERAFRSRRGRIH